MQILAIENELAPIDARRHEMLLRDEARAVWELKKRGVIREIWFTRAHRRAVLLLECRSEKDARRCLAMLPLVCQGLIAFEVIPLRSYDGFDRLFARGGKTSGQSRERHFAAETAGPVAEAKPGRR